MNQRALESVGLRLLTSVSGFRTHIPYLIFAPYLLLFAYLSLSEPNFNWDMIAYVANALNASGDASIAEIQRYIYTNLQHAVPDKDLAYFTNTDSRVVLSKDPEAFGQTIKFFYDTRLVYIGTMVVLIELGVDPFFASYFISTVCSVLTILLLIRLIPVPVPLGMWFALPFIVLAFGLLHVARLSSPDAMAAMVVVFIYWLLIREYLIPVLILVPLSVFVRSDLVLLMPMFVVYFFLLTKVPKLLIGLCAISTVVAYVILTQVLVDPDPWSSLIGYNYGEKPTHPAQYSFEITFTSYLSYLYEGLKSFSYNPLFFVFCALSITGIFMFSSCFFFNPNKIDITHQHTALLFLVVSCTAYVALHFLLFPVTWIRFFTAQYTLVAVVVFWTTLAMLTARNYSERAEVKLL